MNCNISKSIKSSNFNYVKHFKFMIIAPAVILLVGLIMLCVLGFNKGIDFTGGTMVNVFVGDELENQQVFDNAQQKIEQVLFQNNIEASVFQTNNTDIGLCISVRYQDKANLSASEMDELNQKITDELFTAFNYDKEDYEQQNYVLGSQRIDASVGSELLVDSLLAILLTAVLIAIYLMFRFGLVASLTSFICAEINILIALSSIVMFRLELTSSIVAVLITIMSFSFFNSTIMCSSIKENTISNFTKNDNVANISVKHCLYKLVLVTFLGILAYLALCLFGISFALNMALPMIIGIISSFYTIVFLGPALWSFAFIRKKKKHVEKLNTENGIV